MVVTRIVTERAINRYSMELTPLWFENFNNYIKRWFVCDNIPEINEQNFKDYFNGDADVDIKNLSGDIYSLHDQLSEYVEDGLWDNFDTELDGEVVAVDPIEIEA